MQVKSEIGTLAPFVPRALLARLARPIDVLTETVNCTVVFADVSGFTRLSERLARRGEEGSEQLVDLINACFTALLAEAYGRGGSLVKFGGDAMVLLFYDQTGDEQHAVRACCAAAAMRRRLRELGQVQVGDSKVVLRMSVGVHSGEYEMFVVGGSHRELLIGGPAATKIVGLEACASSGQILISSETARMLPRSCVGAEVGPGLALARSPERCEWEPPVGLPTPSDEVIESFLPVAVRAHLLRGSTAPEHRNAAISFLHFGGLDEVIAREGPEVTGRRLDELVKLVQEAVERYEVCFLDTDIANDGIKIRLSAGAPRVVGDDEERMLLALRHVIQGRPPLPVRIGVNRGPVFTCQVGPAYRRWYAVMGDTVNLAARLMAKAPAGHLYATRGVLEDAKTAFAQTALEPFSVKGKSRPVQAWDIGPPVRGASEVAIRMELPLAGRQSELEQLRAAIECARRGKGTLVELVGEPGSGKSRLLAEAASTGRGMLRLRAGCEVYTRDTSYSVWRGLLRQLLGVPSDAPDSLVLGRLRTEVEENDPDLLPWLPLIAIVLDVDTAASIEVGQLASETLATKLQEVVLRFLSRAMVVPTVVEVEQAHLMDAASADLFRALALELESSAWVVLVTRRDVPGGLELPDRPHQRIDLPPLTGEDTLALALGTPEAAQLPPHVVELAVARSGGSPQFLIDLLAAARAGDREHLPDSVEAAARARIDALDRSDAAVVRRAAVLGVSFDPRRLSDVLAPDMPVPDDRFWERLSSVFSRGRDGSVRFRRPALQEVAYASLPFKLRRELHAAIGLRLEQDQGSDVEAGPAVLSNHFALARDYVRAHRYAMLAAKRATERFSHADAARLYRRAIEAGRAGGSADPHALAEAWEQMGEALRSIGEPAAARRALTEARRLQRDDPIAQARLCDRHASVASRNQSLTAAVRWLTRGFRCLESAESAEATAWRARMRSRLGGIRNRQGRWSEAIATCRQAIAEAESVGELRALAHASYSLDWALVESGRAREADYSWRALEIYEQLGDLEHEFDVLNNLGMFAYFNGRWDDAIELYRRAGACSERAGRPADAARVDCNVGEILSDQGHLDEAEVHLKRVRRVWSATGERQAVAFAEVLLGRLAVRRGRAADGIAILELAAVQLRRFELHAYADFAQALIAEAEALAGDAERGLAIARRELRTAERQRPVLERAAGVALARLGQTEAARAVLLDALASARDKGFEYDVAATIDALCALCGLDAELVRERDEILDRLKIARLTPPAAASSPARASAPAATPATTPARA
ncbi:MAG TPA: adenylate/guanylate cyclase domain-containing protein [Solirubrobacteraceae bacterium]|nr:adenylate/guanylate cyclase domain-containing protein [Solirubrobacteraceae bacterium]